MVFILKYSNRGGVRVCTYPRLLALLCECSGCAMLAGLLRFLASAVGMTGSTRTGTASRELATVTPAQCRLKLSRSMFSTQLRCTRRLISLHSSIASLLLQECSNIWQSGDQDIKRKSGNRWNIFRHRLQTKMFEENSPECFVSWGSVTCNVAISAEKEAYKCRPSSQIMKCWIWCQQHI